MPITAVLPFSADAKLSSGNTFTSAIEFSDTDFIVAVSGTFVGTLTLQVRPAPRDVSHDWIDEETYTGPNVRISRPLKSTWQARIGFKAGAYTSGTAHVTLAA